MFRPILRLDLSKLSAAPRLSRQFAPQKDAGGNPREGSNHKGIETTEDSDTDRQPYQNRECHEEHERELCRQIRPASDVKRAASKSGGQQNSAGERQPQDCRRSKGGFGPSKHSPNDGEGCGEAKTHHGVGPPKQPRVFGKAQVVPPRAVHGIRFQNGGIVQAGEKRENRIRQRKNSVLFLGLRTCQCNVGKEHSSNRQGLVGNAVTSPADPDPIQGTCGRQERHLLGFSPHGVAPTGRDGIEVSGTCMKIAA